MFTDGSSRPFPYYDLEPMSVLLGAVVDKMAIGENKKHLFQFQSLSKDAPSMFYSTSVIHVAKWLDNNWSAIEQGVRSWDKLVLRNRFILWYSLTDSPNQYSNQDFDAQHEVAIHYTYCQVCLSIGVLINSCLKCFALGSCSFLIPRW